MSAMDEMVARTLEYLQGRGAVWRTFLQIALLTAVGVAGFFAPYNLLDVDAEVLFDFLVAGSHGERQILLWLLVVGAQGSVYVLALVWFSWWIINEHHVFCREFRCRDDGVRRFKELYLPSLSVLLFILLLGYIGSVFTVVLSTNARETADGGAFLSGILCGIDITGFREHWFPFGVAWLLVGGMYICSLLASITGNHDFERSTRVRAYLRLKRQQEQLLVLAGVILGFSILAEILFYRAYTACQSGEIPEEVIVVGAGVLSLGLALAFIVSRQPFRRIGQSLKEEIVELPGSGSTRNWSDYAKEDQQINQLLGLKGYSFSWLREGVAFLAPIIGAVIPLLLKP